MYSKLHRNLKPLIAVLAIVAVASLILYSFSLGPGNPLATTTTSTTSTMQPVPSTLPAVTTTTIPTAKGTLIVALKDEDHKLPGGAVVKSMNFTVTGIEVYTNETAEWTKVFEGSKTFDLLKYTTNFAKIVEKDVGAGTYSKIKIMLSDGSVSIVNTILGIYKPKIYGLTAQKETTVAHEFNITKGATLTLVLDFNVESSVARIGEGYALTPVIAVSEQAGKATNLEDV